MYIKIYMYMYLKTFIYTYTYTYIYLYVYKSHIIKKNPLLKWQVQHNRLFNF